MNKTDDGFKRCTCGHFYKTHMLELDGESWVEEMCDRCDLGMFGGPGAKAFDQEFHEFTDSQPGDMIYTPFTIMSSDIASGAITADLIQTAKIYELLPKEPYPQQKALWGTKKRDGTGGWDVDKKHADGRSVYKGRPLWGASLGVDKAKVVELTEPSKNNNA